MDEVSLLDAAEDDGLEVNDQFEVSKYLKNKVPASLRKPLYRLSRLLVPKVNGLIDKAHKFWEERNASAVDRGEDPLPPMLPLVRLKVSVLASSP